MPHDDGIVDAKDAASLPIEERENDISLRDTEGDLPASLYRHLERSETFARNEQKPKRKGAKGSCCLLLYGFEDVTFSTLTEKGK